MVVAGKMVMNQAKQADTVEQAAYEHMKTVIAHTHHDGNGRHRSGQVALSVCKSLQFGMLGSRLQ